VHDPALDHSGRLGKFLDNAIRELKQVDEPQSINASDVAPLKAEVPLATLMPAAAPAPTPAVKVDKFAALAAKVARSRKALDARADKLSARLDAFDTKVDTTFNKHESTLDDAEYGIDALDASLAHVGNEDPNEASSG
jgi:hypothetical protein